MDTPAKFEIRFDHDRNLLLWTLRGFWSVEDVMPFAAAMRAVTDPLGVPPVHFDAMCDSRDFPVQSTEVSDALGYMNEVGRKLRTGRTAIVVGSMMNKLQAQRTLAGDDLRVFLSMEEAFAWLGKKASPR